MKIQWKMVLFCLGALAWQVAPVCATPVLNNANNHYYEAVAVSGGVTWADARTAAAARVYQGLAGHLVTIASADENQFVTQNCPAAISGNWWLGGYQDKTGAYSEPAGNWKWVDGSAIGYFNWQSGEPNNNGGYSPPDDYLQILSNGKWNDNTGIIKLGGYVVEYESAAPATLTGKIAFASSSSRESSIFGEFYHDSEIFVAGANGSGALQLTDNNFLDDEPSFNGDGSKIAFVSDRDGNDEIYVMNADGSGVTRLTNSPSLDVRPAFNHAGTKIAFASNRDGNSEIYVMNADGTNVTRLTNASGSDGSPAFSPDGTKIAFSSNRDGNNEIYVMNADGTNQTRLTFNTTDDQNPCFAPDGATVLFAADCAALYSVSTGGGTATLIPSSGTVLAPTYSPDGNWIADYGIQLQRTDGTQSRSLSADGQWPSWAPGDVPVAAAPRLSVGDARIVEGNNGYPKQMIFAVTLEGVHLQTVSVKYSTRYFMAGNTDFQSTSGTLSFAPGEDTQYFSVNTYQDSLYENDETFFVDLSTPVNAVIADGTGVGTIENDDAAPAAPTGKIAFQASRDGNNEIYVMNADGTNQTDLTCAPNNDRQPSWRADGLQLIFSRGAPSGNAGADIYTMNEDGSGLLNLTGDGPDDMEPQYSPDGHNVVYSSFGGQDYDVFKVSTSGGARTRIVNNPLGDYHPRLNPDGTKLLFYTFPNGQTADICVSNPDGSGQVQLTNAPGNDRYAEWSPDGNWIAFTSQRDGNSEIYVMYKDGSNLSRLTYNDAEDEYPCWSPDGKFIAFSSNRDGNFEIYAMNREGAGVRRLTQSAGDDTFPTWAPGDAQSALPRVSVQDATATEGQNEIFTVSLSRASNDTVSVNYQTGGGSATAPDDYAAASGIVTFAPGETSHTVSVATNDDALFEGDETFVLTLSAPILARLDKSSAQGVIHESTRPDLQIKKGDEDDTSYALDNVYQSTPAGAQIETQDIAPGARATYNIAVDNDGASAKSFLLRATPDAATGWTSTYFLGDTDISSQILGDGYSTGNMDAGARQVITVTLTPQAGSGHRDAKYVLFQVFAADTSTPVLDAVEAVASARNLTPTAHDQSVALNEDTSTLITLNGDDGDDDALGFSVASLPSHGALYAGQNANGHRIAADELPYALGANKVFYVPEANWNGSDNFTFTASDAHDTSTPATVAIVVNPINDAPVVAPVDDANVQKGTTFNFSAHATDVDGDTLQFSLVDAPAGASMDAATGAFSWTPAAQDVGDHNFKVRVSDGIVNVEAPVKITVYENNTPPVAANDEYSAHQDLALSVDAPGVLGNDSDAENQTLTATKISGPQHGTLILNSSGAFTYTPNGGFSGDDGFSYQANDGTAQSQTASVTIHVAPPVADLLIKRDDEDDTSYALDDIYQSTPSGAQIETQFVSAGGAAKYWVKVQNDDSVARALFVKAGAGAANWASTFKSGATDITSQITGAGYATSTLAAGASEVIAVELKPAGNAAGGSTLSATLQVFFSQNDATVRDAVRASATLSNFYQGDLLIRSNGESSGAGDGIYNLDAANQSRAQSVNANNAATYFVTVQNDGNVSDSFKISAPPVASGWSAKYFDGNADVSAKVVSSAGLVLPALNAGASHDIKVLVTPGAGVAARATQNIVVSAVSTSDVTRRDAVKLSTTALALPDLLIKKTPDSDTTYALDNTYQSTPSGAQIETQTAVIGGKTSFSIKLQNDGAASRTFVLKTVETAAKPAAWSVVYKSGSTIITPQIKSGSGRISKTLSAGASEIITVETTPLSNQNLSIGDAMTVDFSAFMDATDVTSNAVRDSVRASTLVVPPLIVGADAALRGSGDASFSGEGVINTTGAGQSVAQNTARGRAAIFVMRLKNTGNANDSMKLSSSGAASGWSAKYFDNATGTDISTLVARGTWSTPALAPGASYDVRVEFTPSSSAILNIARTWTLTATSAKDTSKKDVVKATATAK